jgi:CHASE1-domain containing sensor protein/putative methionine-R-sulfoxide reductase with GAF domain
MNQVDLKSGNGVMFRKILPYLVFVVILLLSVYSWKVSTDFLHSKAQERFNFRVAQITQQVIQRLKDYETLLRGGAGLFVATGAVTRQEWRDYVNTLDIEKHYPGVQGIGFVKVLAPSEIEKHIHEIRAEGFPDYAIRPMGDREVYTSIIYIEPFDHRNQWAFGYDMFSEPTRRTAMEKARDTGMPHITGKVKLVQEIDKDVQPGFVMYMPLYKDGDVISTSLQNQARLFGYIGCPFRMRNFVDGIFANTLQDVELKIFDGDNTSENSLMYESVGDHERSSNENEMSFTDRKVIDLYGHQWTLVVSKLSSLEPSYEAYQPLSILVLGSIIALLAFFFGLSLEGTREKALTMADDMTSALRDNEIGLKRMNRALRTISLCNEKLIRATDESEFIRDVCRIAVTEGGYIFAWVGIAEKNEEKTVRVLAQEGSSDGYLDRVRITYGDEQTGRGPTGTAIRNEVPIILKDIHDPAYLPWREEAEKRGFNCSIALPLFVDGAIFGALTLYSTQPHDFNEDEVKLLTDLATDLGFGITTLRTRAATERSREAVQRSEAFLQQIVENIPDMIFIKDAENLNYVSFNLEFAECFR